MIKIKTFIKDNKIEIVIFILALFFSWWLMFSTFSYENGNMLISSKAWSDFASHIPLIRSFSFGDNFLPQYPLFSGPPIKYHFIFYALVGLLEKIGIRIDYALNIPSALGFAFLILMIYIFAKDIFKSKTVGIISIILFLFNGSFSFVNYFKKIPLSLSSISNIFSNTTFPSFGPYDQNIVSAFWNLNIYTNQRHLAMSYGLSLLLIYLVLKFKENEENKNIKKTLFIGIVLGFSFMLNMAIFLMTVVIFLCLFIFSKGKRFYIASILALCTIIALPQYLYIQQSPSLFKIALHPGYLISSLTFDNFISYWFLNFGMHTILMIIGFILASKLPKKIFISFFMLFIIGNLLQFSPEIAANHKFFNYFMIIGVMFSANSLFYFWRKHILLKPIVISLFFFLILSGIIDFFPILNDHKLSLSDYPQNRDVLWIMKNTKPESRFLNTQYLYDNASLAGRRIFLGWPYFSWSQGYDTLTRDNLRKSLLKSNDLKYFCRNARLNNLKYAEISPTEDITINKVFFDNNFITVYKNLKTNIFIYDLENSCNQVT